MKNRFFQIFFFFLMTFFVLFTIAAALFHTQRGQTYFLTYLHRWAEKHQLHLSLEKAEIISPFSFRLHHLQFLSTPTEQVDIDLVELRISPLPLFLKKLVISNLKANHVTLTKLPSESSFSLLQFNPTNRWIDIPITLEISSFQVEHLHLQQEWQVAGKGKIEKQGRTISFALMAHPKQEMNSSLQLLGSFFKKSRSFRFRLIVDTPSLHSLVPTPYDVACVLQVDGSGAFDSFWQMISQKKQASSQIAVEGTLRGKILGLPFLKKEPWNHLQIDRGRIFSSFAIFEDQSCLLSHLFYLNDKSVLKGLLLFDLDKRMKKSDLLIKTKNLSVTPPRLPTTFMEKAWGSIHYDVTESPFFKISLFSPEILLGNQKLESLSLSSLVKLQDRGSLTATFVFKGEKGKAEAKFSWEEEEKLFFLSSASITLPTAHATGTLKRRPDGLMTGRMEIRFEKMNLFYALFPDIPFLAQNGDLLLYLAPDWTQPGKQQLQLQADLTHFHYKNLIGKKAYLSIDMQEPFSAWKGNIKFLLQEASFKDISIQGLFLETSNLQENWPYELLLHGKWKEPFQIRSSGFWKASSEELLVTVETLSGHLLGQPILAPEPIQWEITKDHFSLKDFRLDLASSSMTGSVFLSKKNAQIHLHSNHFPIDFFSFNPLNLRVRGQASIDADVVQEEQKLNSDIHVTLEKIDVYSLAEKAPLKAVGSLQMKVVDNHFHSEGHLAINQAEIMDVSADGQISLRPYPFHVHLEKKEPIFARMSYNGRVEELLDFFDLGTHRLEGYLRCQFQLSKTLEHPEVDGYCQFTKGSYENYYTGTYLKNITAQFQSKKDTLHLESLTASDNRGGALSIQGVLLLDPKKHFPFLLVADLNKLNSIQADLIEATTSGQMQIKGNSLSAKATGQIEVVKASLAVPDRIPPFLPDFPITYRSHPFAKIQEEPKAPYLPYPLYLDVNVFAKDHIQISGKGLNAECKGTLKLEGSYSDLSVHGQLYLIHGDYSFSGRVFTLTQGSLTFPGIPGSLPILSLVGKVNQKGVTITAYLKGPLNTPTLTFESLPPLPLSSIMSLLIFGQDISEISGVQAIQLATAIASLSNGANLLEAARKSLGIDRFTIISSPAATPDESEKIAVQVGKYITKDVLISLSQGTEEGSSNISVEVDLKHGFIFQAETLQEEEQNKFTIKWNINY